MIYYQYFPRGNGDTAVAECRAATDFPLRTEHDTTGKFRSLSFRQEA